VYGTFNSKGDVILSGGAFNVGNWRNRQNYRQVRMPVGQAVLLALSGLLCAFLVAAIVYYHRQIKTKRKSPWMPKHEFDLEGMSVVAGPVAGTPMTYHSAAGSTPLIY
jgi:hypothetical protein